MSNVQIPQLPVAVALDGNEQLEIVQAGVSMRTSAKAIAGSGTVLPLATQVEAELGVANNVVDSPLRVTQQTTARLATLSAAQAGTDSFMLMTPLRTSNFLAAQIQTGQIHLSIFSYFPTMTPFTPTWANFLAQYVGDPISTDGSYTAVFVTAYAPVNGVFWNLLNTYFQFLGYSPSQSSVHLLAIWAGAQFHAT